MADQQQKPSGEPEKGKGKRPAQFTGTAKDRKKARQHIHVREGPSSSSSAHEKKETQPAAHEGLPEGAVIEKATMPMLQAISVVEFAEARAFEISAMEKALENQTGKSGVARVFQTVPRHMRRRAASHNIKRLPRGLHARAQAQMDNDPKQGKSKGQNSNRAEPKRKKHRKHDGAHGGSRWMETHVWNAKRMKIVDLWGWKIPEQPNDKNFRAAYRAATTQCIISDVSYFQVVELEGSVEALNTLLLAVTDPTLPAVASARYISGARQGYTNIHAYLQYPSAAIGPVTFLWKPADPGMSKRTLWIWLHPAIHNLVWNELQAALKAAIKYKDIKINDLKDELVRFEITGPRANAVLHEILQLSEEGEPAGTLHTTNHKLWRDIEDIHTPAALTPGAVIALNVVDPRISFPPKMPPRKLPTASAEQAIDAILSEWPIGVAQSVIWDPAVRRSCLETRQSEGALNKRRSEALVPGTRLDIIAEDVKIPVLLLQRNCRALVSDAALRKESREYAAGWDLVAPKGWANALLRNLVYAGARIGGLRERYMFHFEAGLPCFPYDYPETTAQEAYARMIGADLEAQWRRMPPAKRPNFAKMGIEHPFASPFEMLVSAEVASADEDASKKEDHISPPTAPQTISDSKDKALDAMDLDEPLASAKETGMEVDEPPPAEPHAARALPSCAARPVTVVSSPRLITFLRTALAATPLGVLPDALLAYWRTLTDARFAPELLPNLNSGTTSTLLVRMRIDMLRKGTPADRARVHAATQEEYDFWISAMSKKNDDWGVDDVRNRLDEIPETGSLLGYVTTGSFSTTQGHGMAIACCKLSGLHRVVQEGISAGWKLTRFVLVRDITGRVLLPATFSLIKFTIISRMFVSEVDSKLSTLRELIARLDAASMSASGMPLDVGLVTGITLHSNRIKEIDKTIMSKFVSLVVLDLSSNLVGHPLGTWSVSSCSKASNACLQLEHIAGLEDLQQLHELNLANNRITKISNLGSLRALRTLNLSFNKIKSLEGMEQLHGRDHSLEVLNVKGNEIEGLDMLLYLRGCESLKHLTLGGDEYGFRTQVETLVKAQASSRNIVQPANTGADTARVLRLYDEMRELRDASYAEQRARSSTSKLRQPEARSEDFKALEARLDALVQALAERGQPQSSTARNASAHNRPQKKPGGQLKRSVTDENKRGPRFADDSENVPPEDEELNVSSSSSEFVNSKQSRDNKNVRKMHLRPQSKSRRSNCGACGNGTLFKALEHEEKRLRENEKELLAQIDSLARELRSERDARIKSEELRKTLEQNRASADSEQVEILRTKNAELEKLHAAVKEDLDQALKAKHDAKQTLEAATAEGAALKKQLAVQQKALQAASLSEQNEHDLSVALESQLHAAEEDNARISVKLMKERETFKVKLAKAGKESEIYRDTIQQLQREVASLHQKIASGDYDGRHQLQDFSRHMKAELKSEITEVKAAIAASHKEELNAITKQLASSREAYSSLEEEYRRAIKDQRQASHLQNLCAELSQQCSEQSAALEQRAEKEREMADVIKALTALLNEQKAQIREMTAKQERDYAAFEDKVRELEERLRAMHRLRVELKAAKLENSNLMKSCKDLKAEKEQRREHLEQQESVAQQTVASLKAEVEKLEQKVVSLSKDQERVEQTVRIKNAMLEDQNGTIRTLKQNLENKCREHQSLSAALSKQDDELKDRLEEETLLKHELQQELDSQTELIEHLQAVADDYKSERNSLRAELADVSKKLQDRNDSIHLIEDEVARIRSVFSAKEEKWQLEMTAAVHAEQRANLDMKISYEAQSSRLAALEREREGMLQSLYSLQQDADKMSKLVNATLVLYQTLAATLFSDFLNPTQREKYEADVHALREELARQKQKMDEKMKRLQAAFVEN
ncbi:hypothetical protein HDU86_003755 [Geranomyces michiganensis]|nr:hypothetical protein HDU86_003755 [Geranomyces michiganensis]